MKEDVRMARSVDFLVGMAGETSAGDGPAFCCLGETVTHGIKGILIFKQPFLTGWNLGEGLQDDASAGIHGRLEAADATSKRPECDAAFGIWTNGKNLCRRWRLDEVG